MVELFSFKGAGVNFSAAPAPDGWQGSTASDALGLTRFA